MTNRTADRAFVTLAGQNAVAVVDLAERKVTATIATGRYPHGLRVSPDAARLLSRAVPGSATRRALYAGTTGEDGWTESLLYP